MKKEFYTETPEDIEKIIENSLDVILENWNASKFELANPRDWLHPIVHNYVNCAISEKYPKFEQLDLTKTLIDITDLWMRELLSFRSIVGIQPIVGPLSLVKRRLSCPIEDLNGNDTVLVSSTVECGTHRASVGYAAGAMAEMLDYHPAFDIFSEIKQALASELALSSFKYILETITLIAENNNPSKIDVDISKSRSERLVAENIIDRILKEVQNIGDANGCVGNFVIVSPFIATILHFDRRLTRSEDLDHSFTTLAQIGHIDTYIKVFVSYQLSETILIGFNESYLSDELDMCNLNDELNGQPDVVCRSQSGYIYCPSKLMLDYSPNTTSCAFSTVCGSQLVDPSDGPNNYNNFYRMIQLENLNIE